MNAIVKHNICCWYTGFQQIENSQKKSEACVRAYLIKQWQSSSE